MDNDSIIEVSNLEFGYSQEPVLRGISFEMRKGELLGIIGPNGCGKTTLLRLISGVLYPKRGAVKIKGEEVGQLKRRDLARIVAVVPQGLNVCFPFRVAEIILMGRAPHPTTYFFDSKLDREIARQAMIWTDTLKYADRYIDELSGGEQQRVIMARALAQQPEILLLDEPSAFLDLKHQLDTYDLIRELNRTKGVTVITVLHDLNLASQYCDRLILIDDGKVYKSGSPEVVITEENIRAVYQVEAEVNISKGTGHPYVMPITKTL